jgi:hypothetical protein
MSQITLSGNAAGTGTFTVQSPGTNTNRTLTLPDSDGDLIVRGSSLVRMTPKAFNWNGLTTNTFIEFDTIPSWAKRVTIMLDNVSTSGTASMVLQLGDSGGVETTGYTSFTFTPTSLASHLTGGFILGVGSAATVTWSGNLQICNLTGNTWAQSGVLGSAAGNWGGYSGGSKTLSAALDRIRLLTGNGTDTFDGGTVNVMYEG